MKEKDEISVQAISLISGGLDSQLAAKIILDQGVHVVGVYFETGFLGDTDRSFFDQVESDLGVDIRLRKVDEDRYSELILNPDHGYGSSINPCIDCRIYTLSLARKMMEDLGADFVVTGEVLGQRPMTQNRDSLNLIRRKSGLKDRLLRPLSAKLLPPTLPEKEGWASRQDLFEISGRSRKEQLELAEKYGIEEYHQPAGGCLLTENAFAKRAEELFSRKGRPHTGVDDLKLLKYGRHFLLPGGGKAIVGRDREDNEALSAYLDGHWGLRVVEYPGPLTLTPSGINEEDLLWTAALTGRYSQGRDVDSVRVELIVNGGEERTLRVAPLDRDDSRITDRRI
ncbi:hypothetical protein KGY64_05960 [Candidatus Bipolaricaulota bacterium]|nr:hypothetical protein [Candidatus Bipolaricaulota bacterium]